jgi:hypothetical protein
LYRGLAELLDAQKGIELDAKHGFGNDRDALFGGLLNALG